jgi:hypothetical protein
VETNGPAQRERLLAHSALGVKCIFALALLRLFAAPMSKELFNNELLPMPTWEWSVCSVTPGVLIYVARRPRDWKHLSDDVTIIKWALRFYLAYGLAFALLQEEWMLWVAVLSGIGGLVSIRQLDGVELSR